MTIVQQTDSKRNLNNIITREITLLDQFHNECYEAFRKNSLKFDQ